MGFLDRFMGGKKKVQAAPPPQIARGKDGPSDEDRAGMRSRMEAELDAKRTSRETVANDN